MKRFKLILVLILLGTWCVLSSVAHAGAWADYKAIVTPLFKTENIRLDRIHHPTEPIELGFTLEIQQTGVIREVKIISSSGSEELDALAVESAYGLSPLPTPPASVFFRQFFTPLTFRYSLNPKKVVVTQSNTLKKNQETYETGVSSQNGGNRSGQIDNRTRSDLVVGLQRELTRIGIDPGPVDGLFGDNTAAAIRSFQQQSGLPVDGRPSKQLLQRLNTYKKGQNMTDSGDLNSAENDLNKIASKTTDGAEGAQKNKKFYEDYEYIDQSGPKVYEDYEVIDQ
ncbi:MAG: peptidoglycan-binding protein [Arenicellales bacterium]